jgi:hypothetical protein
MPESANPRLERQFRPPPADDSLPARLEQEDGSFVSLTEASDEQIRDAIDMRRSRGAIAGRRSGSPNTSPKTRTEPCQTEAQGGVYATKTS